MNDANGDSHGHSIEAWKKSIEVQQHFNEICMKIRNFYISFIAALLAFIGVIAGRSSDPFFELGLYKVHIALPVISAIIIATYLFYFIDRHWYHRLLVGSVQNAIKIEERLKDEVYGIELSTTIGRNSPLDVSSRRSLGALLLWLIGIAFGSDRRVWSENAIHSDAKISMFYKSIGFLFIVFLIAGAAFGGVGKKHPDTAPVTGGEMTTTTPADRPASD